MMNSTQLRSRRFHVVIGLISLLFVSVLVVRTSVSAFSSTADNNGNQWTAGDVILEDDDSGAVMFTVGDMKPGDSDTHCIEVTYKGSLDANVKMHGSLTPTLGDGLDDFLNLTVRRGTPGNFADCGAFVSSEVVYNGTIDGFVLDHPDFDNGAGTWAPTGGTPDDPMTYEFVVTLQDANGAQGLTTIANFSWEAQNT
ncbi:MAG: CalY family protein [Acidimicrobiia bacterium]|nr:CalY family protein [Acidimicrobiia bacterium]